MVDKISNSGQEAEELFEKLVHSSRRSSSPSSGDLVVIVDDEEHFVEVKSCNASRGGNANQVRAIKYLTVVVHTPKQSQRWIVIPANTVLAHVVSKERGQHSEIPFENATVNLRSFLPECGCSDDELDAKVEEAIRGAQAYPDLKRSMELLMYDLKRLSYRSRHEVTQILRGSRPPYWLEEQQLCFEMKDHDGRQT